MAQGLVLRVTHAGVLTVPVLLTDVEDGSDFPNTRPRPGGVYVPVGSSTDLVFTDTVAMSFEQGSIRGFLDSGDVTAQFIPGAPYAADLMQLTFTLDFIGKGVGASKTTTVRDGPTLAEEFAVGDEVFAKWRIAQYIDRTKSITFRVHAYLNSSEVGKLVSFELDVGLSDGTPVDTILGTETVADEPVNDQFLDFHMDFVLDGATYLPANADALQFVVRRIASSDDPVADVRVHLLCLTAQV